MSSPRATTGAPGPESPDAPGGAPLAPRTLAERLGPVDGPLVPGRTGEPARAPARRGAQATSSGTVPAGTGEVDTTAGARAPSQLVTMWRAGTVVGFTSIVLGIVMFVLTTGLAALVCWPLGTFAIVGGTIVVRATASARRAWRIIEHRLHDQDGDAVDARDPASRPPLR